MYAVRRTLIIHEGNRGTSFFLDQDAGYTDMFSL